MKTEQNCRLQTYQDLVLQGETIVTGSRNCQERWEILRPYLPRSGSVLDVGSNMGWFGWSISQGFPDCVVASVEPDEQSATLQRQVLQSHGSQRICLLTARADTKMARVFAQAGQQFDAVLCLSVLHWLPEHRGFLATVGPLSRRILVEQPDPRECGAGFEHVRAEIGAIGGYLESLFPDRPVRRLAQLPSHRESAHLREIWLVDEPLDMPADASAGLDVEALLSLSPSWPPRDWWLQQHSRLTSGNPGAKSFVGQVLFTAGGLELHEGRERSQPVGRLRRRLARLPQERLLRRSDWLYRRVRRLGGQVLRGLRLRRSL